MQGNFFQVGTSANRWWLKKKEVFTRSQQGKSTQKQRRWVNSAQKAHKKAALFLGRPKLHTARTRGQKRKPPGNNNRGGSSEKKMPRENKRILKGCKIRTCVQEEKQSDVTRGGILSWKGGAVD